MVRRKTPWITFGNRITPTSSPIQNRRLAAGPRYRFAPQQQIKSGHEHHDARHQQRAGVVEVMQARQDRQRHRPFAPMGEKHGCQEQNSPVSKIARRKVKGVGILVVQGFEAAEQHLIPIENGGQPETDGRQAQHKSAHPLPPMPSRRLLRCAETRGVRAVMQHGNRGGSISWAVDRER